MSTTATKEAPKTKVITGKVRFGFVKVWKAEAFEEGDEPKYSVQVYIDKEDKATMAKVNEAVNLCVEQAKAKNGGKLPPKFKMPVRDGDEEESGYPERVGKYFFNASSKNKPQIVDKDVNPILNQDEFYSGVYGRASLNFFVFGFDKANSKQKGIAVGLNNLQKLEDGEPLTGGSSAADDFGGDFATGTSSTGGADLDDIL